MLIVRSPVRISFAGGGTDLPAYFKEFGGAVLSTAIDKYSYTILGERRDGRVQVISSEQRIFETWQDIVAIRTKGNELEIPLTVLKDLGRDIALDMFLVSEIPAGTGLGSSASACVGILRALTAHLQIPLSQYELAERSFHIVRNLLGRHIGKQDGYAAAFGGLNFVTFYRDGGVLVEPLALDTEIIRELQSNLLLYFTGSAPHSWAIVKGQQKTMSDHTHSAVDALHKVRKLADRMREALGSGNLAAFGSMLDEVWQAKKRVSRGISNSRIDQLYRLAREHGALGGKITGAGGGGCLLLYCEPKHQESVRVAMASTGINEMTFAFDSQGAQVIVNDSPVVSHEHGRRRRTVTPASAA
jgi:D-glycero-alpha-D-manno-heptose-7-phosphate kinase